MLEKIKLKYSHFHDAQVNKIKFIDEAENVDLHLSLCCASNQNDYNLDHIKIKFYDVSFFNFNYQKNKGVLTIFACLLKKELDIITFDFDCIFYDKDNLEENPSSNFIIKCKGISYEVLSSE